MPSATAAGTPLLSQLYLRSALLSKPHYLSDVYLSNNQQGTLSDTTVAGHCKKTALGRQQGEQGTSALGNKQYTRCKRYNCCCCPCRQCAAVQNTALLRLGRWLRLFPILY